MQCLLIETYMLHFNFETKSARNGLFKQEEESKTTTSYVELLKHRQHNEHQQTTATSTSTKKAISFIQLEFLVFQLRNYYGHYARLKVGIGIREEVHLQLASRLSRHRVCLSLLHFFFFKQIHLRTYQLFVLGVDILTLSVNLSYVSITYNYNRAEISEHEEKYKQRSFERETDGTALHLKIELIETLEILDNIGTRASLLQ
ncbi:hypothetical protein HELRODRAFT_165492 [Helobdella robusta]|uniref:Uncharacterized protein n=1 Tax=Helobdella robusta TaxID=6412 RepID=T1EWW7_HELRO|nr:hypothetical protein HELRODRAFT_165492 [Helobdella robusta]ESN91456.1 hypothetical protein HELRODRAFT_165492 [Helobdella robusta]